MKRYRIVNTSLGWLCFAIAAVTYMMTLEPTASFWDCPEFILQGFKQEVGHPPGNPIFVMTARFFINFTGGDVTKVALAVNAMSGILSALTVLFLFWTITHLVRRLIVPDGADNVPAGKLLAIMGSGICGAMMFAWSDTFWFSAVEGEVYAFSSFCTAVVFWLILKWEDIADEPHSDRYLVLIAYVIGLSIGVHLLNLLCIPAIGLVIYYRKARRSTARGSLLALAGSAVVIALILYGLMPGFIKLAGVFELFCVNTLNMGYNMGVLTYAMLFLGISVWSLWCIYNGRIKAAKISFTIMVVMSGMPFIGDGWGAFFIITVPLLAALTVYLFRFKPSMRLLGIASLSIFVIFIGYTSYALLLIRATANPAVNQNSPDNVFELKSYISREQYGETPLFTGQSFASGLEIEDGRIATEDSGVRYRKAVKTSPDEPDRYVELPGAPSYRYAPVMLFPRMYSSLPEHVQGYKFWADIREDEYKLHELDEPVYKDGQITQYVSTPTQLDNLRYFFNYQVNHMYWRYFLWNFAGRQNDIQGNGEPNRGNWISGIPAIDNYRLGDQSLLPAEYGEENAGHNVYYMLPLLLGLLGLLWQAFMDKRGIEQFWVVFFLFFMTGLAIVLYLNQVPSQPRERDYAFAGSFYAFAIWVGMGIAAIWSIIMHFVKEKDEAHRSRISRMAAAGACAVAVAVPLQVVSQTRDDHDRSGRYTTRDYGMNYLAGLDKNAVIFTNGDNDTFPLWYAQEVEGYRTDVRVVNLSYLATEWYANQMRLPSYDAPGIKLTAKPEDYAYDRLQFSAFDLQPNSMYNDYEPTHPDTVSVASALGALYGQPERDPAKVVFPYPAMYIPANVDGAVKAGVITPAEAKAAVGKIYVDLYNDPVTCVTQEYYNDYGGISTYVKHPSGVTLSQALSLDMIANSVADGWSRPFYFSMTVPDSYYVSLSPYLFNTGLSYELTPLRNASYNPVMRNIGTNTDKMYRNVVNEFRWGGLDGDKHLYLDETVRRMVDTHRQTLIALAQALIKEGAGVEAPGDIIYNNGELLVEDAATGNYAPAERIDVGDRYARDRFDKALEILRLCEAKMPASQAPWAIRLRCDLAENYLNLGRLTDDDSLTEHGLELLEAELLRYGKYLRYYDDLRRRGLFGRLSAIDAYVPRYLYSTLLLYSEFGDVQALDSELRNQGVDLNAIREYLQ